MMNKLRNRMGSAAVEYVLITALLAAGTIALLTAYKSDLQAELNVLTTITDALK
jgi:Flp pilus assembly pilin Flp